MIISNWNQIENTNISLSGQPIARTSNHKFLDVFNDDEPEFDIHINKLCSNVSQSIGLMRRIVHLVPVNVLRNLYYTLIYSRLAYAMTAWRSTLSSTTRWIKSIVYWKEKVISLQCLFFAIHASDITISAVPTNHNTFYIPFRRSTAFVHI